MTSLAQHPASGLAAAHAPRRPLWLTALAVCLLGYALFGKGWAYVGVPPVFVGEMLLALGIVSLLFLGRWRGMPDLLPLWSVALLVGWGAYCTVPYYSEYGMDALRDAVIWGYAAFAVVVLFYILADPRRLAAAMRMYRIFAIVFLIGTPIVWAARYIAGDAIPRWPWADVPIIDPKPGDVMVHLSGILAFWVAGGQRGITVPRLLLLAGCAAVIGAYERAGMFAFVGVFLLCAILRPRHSAVYRIAGLGLLGLTALWLTDARFEVPVADSPKIREVSLRQFVGNVISVISPSDMGDMDDTRDWRLEWWTEIINYTANGPYFWTGKGFGVNLADDDGFQVMPDHSLRSPHNGHLTILARAGVPGLAIWLLVQFSWAWGILIGYIRSQRAGRRRWAGLFLFLLAYWLAFMINSAFDVFLEGPMGGVWFWSLYGLGMAAMWIHRRWPEMLSDDANPAGA